jgi:hypothetical protein
MSARYSIAISCSCADLPRIRAISLRRYSSLAARRPESIGLAILAVYEFDRSLRRPDLLFGRLEPDAHATAPSGGIEVGDGVDAEQPQAAAIGDLAVLPRL